MNPTQIGPGGKNRSKSMSRTYNQDCILAHALDLLGERWTMLILRDLFLGPRRFGDLQAGLHGLGANLLSKRLKELDEAGILIAPGDAGGGYRLSEIGESLRPAIRQLMKWSVHYFRERPEPSPARDCIYSDDLQPDSVALAVELFANHCPQPGASYVAHLIIDNYAYTLYYMNDEMIARRGADAPAVAKLSTDVATMMKAFRGELSRSDALKKIKVSGDEKAIAHVIDCIVHDHEGVMATAAAS